MTRDEFIRQWEGEFVAYDDVEFLRDLDAMLDAERAKAREEQREACAFTVERHDPELDLVAFQVRSTLLTATPLTDRIAELEALIRSGAQAANELTLDTQTPEEWTADLVRQVREARARAETAEAGRDEARAEAERLSDLHPRCEAYDDQPGPSCVQWRARAEKAEAAADLMARHRYLARAVATDTATYDEALELGAIRERLDAGEWKMRAEKAETELREVLSVLEGGGPAIETLFALAQRGTAKKIRALLGLTLAPEVGP